MQLLGDPVGGWWTRAPAAYKLGLVLVPLVAWTALAAALWKTRRSFAVGVLVYLAAEVLVAVSTMAVEIVRTL